MSARLGWGLAAAGAVLVPFVLPTQYSVHVAILVLLFAFLGTAWNLLAGFGGQHSFGHAVFVGTGAYTTALLNAKLGVNPWIGMVAAGLVALALGAVIGYLSFRYEIRGPFFLLATIAFAEIALLVTQNTRFLGGASGVVVPPSDAPVRDFQFTQKGVYYLVMLALLALAVWLVALIRRRRFGIYLLAIRENEDAAKALGIDTFRWKLYACVASAFLSGIGGAFYAQYYLFVDPVAALGLTFSVQIATNAIVGGMGTLAGPLVGAALLIPGTEAIRSAVGVDAVGLHLVLYGIVLILVIRWLPEGIVGRVREVIRARAA